MKTQWVWLVPALAAAGLHAQSTITREGNHWIEVAAGSLGVESRLRVTTRGAVSLRGEDRQNVVYTVKKRARTPSEAKARVMLANIKFKPYKSKGWSILDVYVPPEYDGAADVLVRVPKRLAETELHTQIGPVEAYDLEGGLFAKTGAGEIQIERIGGLVRTGTGGGNIRIGKITGPVKAMSGGGSITAVFLGGDAYLDTAGGDIVVREARGRVQASAGSGGNIRVERADRDVTLSTGGGTIDISGVEGPVRANTGKGAIKVRAARNAELISGGQIQLFELQGGVQATTAMGAIVAELGPGKLTQDSVLTAQSGDITVYIASNVAVTVDAINASPGGRRIISEFAEVQPRLAGGNLRSEARGAINGGGSVLRLVAQSGTIYLRRRK